MNINRINSQKGITQFLIIAVMAFLALGIPTATKLVQQNQENRSKAAENAKTTSEIKYDFNLDGKLGKEDVQVIQGYIVSLPQNPYDINNDNQVDIMDITKLIDIINSGNGDIKKYDFNLDGKLGKEDVQVIQGYIVSLPQNPYDINNDNQVDIMDITKLIDIINNSKTGSNKLPTKTPTPSPITTDEVSLFHNFAPKDYSIRKIGSVLTNDILIKTGGKKIDTATIVYCYTDLLKPDFNSVSGEQIAKVVSNKEIGNNCAELKVILNDKQINDPFPMYQGFTGYIISYSVTVVKYGKGTLKIDCAKSSLLDINGEKIVINDPNCGYNNGSEFTLTDLETRLHTPTSIPTPHTPTSTLTPPIVEVSRITKIGKYIDLSLYPDELSSISDKNLNLWLDRLNLAYEDYFELTGWKPHDGKEITIQSVECGDKCPGWAWADSSPVISWAKQWSIDELKKINNNDDWIFGILHEISHKFDNYDSWGGFDNEMMANFKMAYLIEKENGKVSPGYSGKYYVGSQIINYYKLTDNGYDYAINQNTYSGDFLTYVLLRIKNQLGGWNTYKQVFRNLGGKKLDSNNIKINAFLDEISIVSKKDVRKMFNQEEKAIMELKFGKVFPTEIDGKCNTSLNKCLSGTFKDLPDTTTQLIWQCSGITGGKSVKCSIRHNLTTPPQKITPEINENGACGDVTKIITNTCVSGSPIDLPDTLNEYIWECKGVKTTQRCVKIKGSDDNLCPKNQFNYWGKCENDLEIGWGCDRDGVCISGKCDLTTNRCVNKNFKTPATNIRISPLGLSLKVGQNKNLTYILTPNNTTDTVKWSTTGNGQVRIQKITLKCADNPNAKCMDTPGINNLLVTGLKAGTVKIKLTTSSGKTAQATVVVQK